MEKQVKQKVLTTRRVYTDHQPVKRLIPSKKLRTYSSLVFFVCRFVLKMSTVIIFIQIYTNE